MPCHVIMVPYLKCEPVRDYLNYRAEWFMHGFGGVGMPHFDFTRHLTLILVTNVLIDS